jgi:Ca2+-binding EF-hand superfamily protein
MYAAGALKVEDTYFKSVKRYAFGAFQRAQLARLIAIQDWDRDELFNVFDADKDGRVSINDFRQGMNDMFQMKLSPSEISKFRRSPEDQCIDKETFLEAIEALLENRLV